MGRVPDRVASSAEPSLVDRSSPCLTFEVTSEDREHIGPSALLPWQRAVKRAFDVVISCMLFVFALPLLLAIALAIKVESRGPIIFVQKRVGENGVPFLMYKFRSMNVDAESRWAEVAGRTEPGMLLHKQRGDPRVTHVGGLLRRASLDELPQLINVLRGEMSLVGPRPELPFIVRSYEAWQWRRFCVPSGITGWWQVNGRSTRLMHLHTQDDLYYVEHYSFRLDILILCRTVRAVLCGHGAF